MPSYAAIAQKKEELVRKGLDGSVFRADMDAAAITAANLVGTDGLLQALPDGWGDLGLVTDDGAQFSRAVSTSDITSWGRSEPSRSDVISDVTTLKVACQETKLETIGLYIGADISAVTPGTHGQVSIQKPAAPRAKYHRVLSLAVDDTDDGEIYIARFLPRAKVTAYDDQSHSRATGLFWGVTLTGYVDSTLGYSEDYIFAGPGWEALLTGMGFTVGS